MTRFLGILAATAAFFIAATFIAASLWDTPGDALTPAGFKRNTSVYIDMPDGARIAADIWLPQDLEPGARVPTVIEGTRYWRETGLTLLGRAAAMFGADLPGVTPSGYNAFFPARGYAMMTIDVRGTGASSGVHTTEYSLEETEDYRHVIEWVTTQPWSSGDVFAVGISYSGTSAELMTATNHPALKAVAPLYADFDAQMQLATPGGVYQPAFIEIWSEMVAALDQNDFCGVMLAGNPDASPGDCRLPELLVSGVKPVDGETDYLPKAVQSHNSPNVAAMVQSLTYRDSAWGATEVTPGENLPYGMKGRIEASGVPMFVVTGWFDAATTNGALARFATFENVQEVWIGAFSHGGGYDTDPYKPADAPSAWPGTEQLEKVLAFFERYRSDGPASAATPAGAATQSILNYYVNGADSFRTTTVWPPEHLTAQKLYLSNGSKLSTTMPASRGFARYTVDPAAATAATSRWATQMGGGDVIYDRRNEMAERVLHYTSEPFEADTELTGSIVLDLWMTSDRTSGALHTYLEDVAPDGTIRYLTEGVLNLQHRATTDTPPYPMFGPTHSFLQGDAESLPQGQLFSFSTTLYATSALIKRGHQLRLSIAGADAASFAPVPAMESPPTWNVYNGPTSPSSVTVHTAPWQSTQEDSQSGE